jgi:hypothetical protein
VVPYTLVQRDKLVRKQSPQRAGDFQGGGTADKNFSHN